MLERAGERGRRVHEATAAFDLGQLDIEALDAELVPYVLAWSQFLIESRAEIVDVERPGWHPKYRYAGTRDRRLRIARRNAIADIKATAKISRVDALQTAAYAAIDEENSGTPISTRLTVQLRPDGTYRVQTWREKTDFAVFLAQMTVHNWRNQA